MKPKNIKYKAVPFVGEHRTSDVRSRYLLYAVAGEKCNFILVGLYYKSNLLKLHKVMHILDML